MFSDIKALIYLVYAKYCYYYAINSPDSITNFNVDKTVLEKNNKYISCGNKAVKYAESISCDSEEVKNFLARVKKYRQDVISVLSPDTFSK